MRSASVQDISCSPARSSVFAAFTSRSSVYPHPHANILSESVMPSLMSPHRGHILVEGKNLSTTSTLGFAMSKRDAFIDGPALGTHPRRREEAVYDKHIWICNELCLQCSKRTVLHLLSEESLMPSPDVLILHDDELPSRDDVMVYLIGLCLAFIAKLLILPPNELLRVIPAPGTLPLPGKLLLQPLEAFRFSDRYIVLLSFRGCYRCLYAEVEADVSLVPRLRISLMLWDVACELEIYP